MTDAGTRRRLSGSEARGWVALATFFLGSSVAVAKLVQWHVQATVATETADIWREITRLDERLAGHEILPSHGVIGEEIAQLRERMASVERHVNMEERDRDRVR